MVRCTHTDEPESRDDKEVYDNKGDVKEHRYSEDNHITIYDKDWKTKGDMGL